MEMIICWRQGASRADVGRSW